MLWQSVVGENLRHVTCFIKSTSGFIALRKICQLPTDHVFLVLSEYRTLAASSCSTKSKMSSSVLCRRFVCRCRFSFPEPIWFLSRGLSWRGKTKTKVEEQKYQDNVYLLNVRQPSSHTFAEAMAALRAYSLTKLDQTVELHVKISMGEKKVQYYYAIRNRK